MNLRTSGSKISYRISYKKMFIGNFNVFQKMEICEWINNLRIKKMIVKKSVILKAREVNPSFGNKSISSKISWVYRFLKRKVILSEE